MAILEIDGKEYQAKATFKFDRLADKKYSEEDNNGNKMGGFMTLYMNLLQYSTKHLIAFWDCGLEHYKEKPTIEKIEEALEARIEQDGDAEQLFKEAFSVVDQSGFFKIQARNFWKDFAVIKETGKTKEEKDDNKKMYERLTERRKELTESTTTN